ncbi:hypothetical protein, partial [uncultured Jannaschia sp.]|uniref:hypothetical protein n=1 Tax=uncultured Jannaschia sp. TaxID=293347 RepID=UPI00263657FE
GEEATQAPVPGPCEMSPETPINLSPVPLLSVPNVLQAGEHEPHTFDPVIQHQIDGSASTEVRSGVRPQDPRCRKGSTERSMTVFVKGDKQTGPLDLSGLERLLVGSGRNAGPDYIRNIEQPRRLVGRE